MASAEPIIWTFHVMGRSYVVSPYVLFCGVGLILSLFVLESALKRMLPAYQNRFYVCFVISGVVGVFGAHVLDWLVTSRPFTQAGFTFYGGLLVGTVCFVLVAARIASREAAWIALNAAALPLVMAHAVGRVGCFFAGCCYGSPCDPAPYWPFERHPTQLYEAVFLAVLAVALPRFSRHRFTYRVAAYALSYGLFRFFVEFIRADERGQFGTLSTSQWISLAVVAGAMIVVAKTRSSRRNLAGLRSAAIPGERLSLVQ